jgi:glycerol kinase
MSAQLQGTDPSCLFCSSVAPFPLPAQSDILQVPVVRPDFQETTALGAALAAGLAVGLWDESFVLSHPKEGTTTFTPAVSSEDSNKRYQHWRKAVSRCVDLADLAL